MIALNPQQAELYQGGDGTPYLSLVDLEPFSKSFLADIDVAVAHKTRVSSSGDLVRHVRH